MAGSGALRIVLVTECLDGGVGRHVTDVALGLGARHHHVHVAYASARANPALVHQLSDEGSVHLHTLDMQRALGLGDVAAMAAFHRWLRAHGPFDIIHAHSAKAGLVTRMVPRGKAHLVYTPHAFATLDPQIGMVRRLAYGLGEWALAHRAGAILAGSRFEYDHALGLGLSKTKLHTIVNGIADCVGSAPDGAPKTDAEAGPGTPADDGARSDEPGDPAAPPDPAPKHGTGHIPHTRTRPAQLAALNLRDHALCVGFVGRLSPQKDPLMFARAFVQAVETLPDAPLFAVMIGGGELEDQLRAYVQASPAASRFRLLGAVNAADWMGCFDMLAMSSRYEAMPYVLVEALFHALPIVATRVAGTEETIDEGKNGVRVPVGDHGSLAAAIVQLAQSTALRHAYGRASRDKASGFRVEVMIARLLDVYRQLKGAQE